MNDVLKCDICNSDAGDNPYHATIDENGHVHVCDGCFYPEHYDLGVLWRHRERALAKLNASERRLHEVATLCATVEQQRDELLETMRELIRWVPVYPKAADGVVGGRVAYQRALDNARAAIAAVTSPTNGEIEKQHEMSQVNHNKTAGEV